MNVGITHYSEDTESKEYQACRFVLDGQRVICRTAKITPTKIGQFVTLWKRNHMGKTCPFDATDELDLIIINCRSVDHAGYFIFPKSVLLSKGILSAPGKVGKMGIRVYPPWDKADNPQAMRTQAWQLEHFTLGNRFSVYAAQK